MNVVVAVIIPWSPAHTPAEMLDEAKESVRQQTVETEIILITDERQRGPAWARNVGLKRTTRRYIAVLDADDIWKPGKLKRQLNRMSQTGAALCVEGEPMSTDQFIRDLFVNEIESITPSILLDTDQVTCRFEEELTRREDHLFMLEAASAGGVCFCPDLVEVRKHDNGLTASTTASIHIENSKRFRELANQRVPKTRLYTDKFNLNLYFRHGRFKHGQGEFTEAIRSFSISLNYGFRLKTIAAVGLSILGLIGLPAQSI